jgi:hypothetical protein
MKRNWPESKVREAEVEVREEEKQLPRTKCINPRMKKRNLKLTLKEEEVHRGDNMPTGTLFRELEEEEEEEVVR